MANHDSPVPLYIQIKDYLRLNIQNGVFPVNTRIPSERRLAEQFGVNRLTVSKALDELAQEGLVYAQVGKGTYVAPVKIDQTLQSLTSFSQDMQRRGYMPSSRVIYAGIDPASPEVARALSIPSGAEVAVLERVRLADGQIIALEQSHILYAVCPGILANHDFSRESLYHVLRTDYRLRLTHAHQTIEAQVVTAGTYQHLEAEPGTPVLSITRVTYTEDNTPVEFVRSAYRGDRYKFVTMLQAIE